MRRAVIIDVVRSPFGRGRPGGALDGVHPVDLYAQVLQALVRRTGIDPAMIEDVITGCVIQVAEQSGNIGRQAVLAAGFPERVPSVTLDRKCGSAQQAFDFAAQGVIAGAYDLVIAGGVEMMSLVPMRANRMGKDNEGPAFHRRYPQGLVRQGVSAELIAARWGIGREAMDTFALELHRRAVTAEDRGATARAITPVDVPALDGLRRVERDEGPRRDSSLEKLGALRPAFEDAATGIRFPEIRWSVTAGNSRSSDRRGGGAPDRRRVRRGAARPQASRGDHAFCARRRRSCDDADGNHACDAEDFLSARACPSTVSIVSRSTRPSRQSSSHGSRTRAPIRIASIGGAAR